MISRNPRERTTPPVPVGVVAAPAAPTAADVLGGCTDELDSEGVEEAFVFSGNPSLEDLPCAGGFSGMDELYRRGCRTCRNEVLTGTIDRDRYANAAAWEPIPFWKRLISDSQTRSSIC